MHYTTKLRSVSLLGTKEYTGHEKNSTIAAFGTLSYVKSWSMLFAALLIVSVSACDFEDIDDIAPPDNESTLYFPPTDSDEWTTTTLSALNWDEEAEDELYDFLATNGTRAFIVLKDGKIVMEEYWGRNFLRTAPFDANTEWYWASAGKTVLSFLIGKAHSEGHLDIEASSSNYLGEGWTTMSADQESMIKVRHHLSMSTGVDYRNVEFNCVEPSCLTYRTAPDEQWYYHNATYLLLRAILTNATGTDYKDYTDQILSPIGMNGNWRGTEDISRVYWSVPRDMARFGLLILNNGSWGETPILADPTYFESMTTSSQDINTSYGYLWWLNGQSTVVFPQSPAVFNRSLAPAAPDDLIAGMGKNGQYVNVVPSQNLVVVRMGEAPNDDLVPAAFHNEMWTYLNAVIQ